MYSYWEEQRTFTSMILHLILFDRQGQAFPSLQGDLSQLSTN